MTRLFRTVRLVPLAVLALALGLPAASAAPAAAATTTYTITNLGSLGYGVTDGVAINNNGQVTGRSGQVVGTDADGNTGHSQLFRPGRGLLPGCDQR
jgi:polyisoprenoid-binding protein YceI